MQTQNHKMKEKPGLSTHTCTVFTAASETHWPPVHQIECFAHQPGACLVASLVSSSYHLFPLVAIWLRRPALRSRFIEISCVYSRNNIISARIIAQLSFHLLKVRSQLASKIQLLAWLWKVQFHYHWLVIIQFYVPFSLFLGITSSVPQKPLCRESTFWRELVVGIDPLIVTWPVCRWHSPSPIEQVSVSS